MLDTTSNKTIKYIFYKLKSSSILFTIEGILNHCSGIIFNVAFKTYYLVTNSTKKIFKNFLWGIFVPFVKVFILRGIGYQASIIENFFTKTIDRIERLDFPFNRYLLLRVGHSFCLYIPLPLYTGVLVKYKDRKVIIYGPYKDHTFNFASTIGNHRFPSVYTGRGIRSKGYPHIRKLGKKDIRKGRI